jgi:hypothetical protein
MNPPTQEQIDRLVVYARSFLSVQPSVETTKPLPENKVFAVDIVRSPATTASSSAQPGKPGRKKLWFWGIPLLLVIVGGSIYGIFSIPPGGHPAPPTVTSTVMPSLVSISPTVIPSLTPSLPPVLPTAASRAEVETLIAEIRTLVKQTTSYSSYSYTIDLTLNKNLNNVSVTLDSFLQGKPERTQSFTLPGEYTCKVSKGAAGYLVELHAKEYWNLGPYEESTANALCDKFTRLNTILGK